MGSMQKPVRGELFSSRIVLFMISQNLSLFGSSVVGFAIIWYITIETSSGLWLMYAWFPTYSYRCIAEYRLAVTVRNTSS